MKIAIDAGHGGSDPGAVFRPSTGSGRGEPVEPRYQEKEICLSVAIRLKALLEQAGHDPFDKTQGHGEPKSNHDVFLTRTDDSFVALYLRAQRANAYGAEIFVSLHCNADPDPDEPGMPEARGEEIWIYGSSNLTMRQSKSLANAVAYAITKNFPDEPFRGVKEGNLAVLRLSRAPACLVELGFIDNSDTVRKLSDLEVQMAIARTIVEGIETYAKEGRGQI